MPIDPQTWRELFEAVYEVHSAKNHADFASAVVAGMQRLITANVIVFQLLDRNNESILTRMAPEDPFTADEVAYYTAHSDEMPLVPYYARTGDPKARRMSDVIAESEWLESKYYRVCLQRLDLPYCIALPITVDASSVAALSFNRRGGDFTPHDCELLDAFAPHFRLAWERHENPWAGQRQLHAQRQLQEFGLTPRESEVLFWMTEGKQNREIATILELQLGTVQQHVASILAKLGQKNRHAAIVFALGVLKRC
ncbi:hypothetical protein BH09VER1_BH09VER1_46990 [soil metagenome]